MSADGSGTPDGTILRTLLEEVLRDSHGYVGGIAPVRGAKVMDRRPTLTRAAEQARELARDATERAARSAGFVHRHYDPAAGADALMRIIELLPRLEATFDGLRDEASRRALLDLLKLRVVGPYHTSLGVTAQRYRAMQARAERDLVVRPGTFEVADPWFSPLSLYRVPVGDGHTIMLHTHSVSVVSVFELRQYELRTAGRRIGACAGDVVFDVGGCWGDTALLFAHQVGPEGRVYTFEFDPENLLILAANLELNPELAERIEVVPSALWERSGERISYRSAGAATSVVPDLEDPGAPSVETVAIDDFVERAPVDRVSFVKMDVEGSERAVLAGAARTLERFRPRLALAAYHRDDDLAVLPELIDPEGRGYELGLGSFSALEDETVLFATADKKST